MNTNNFLITIISILILGNLTACASPKARFDITVIDKETEMPIENASLIYRFNDYKSKPPGTGWGTIVVSYEQEKKTNEKGFSTATGKCNAPKMMGVAINKEGYYKSSTGFLKEQKVIYNILLHRWEPWPCESIVKLRPIKYPVPMFVKNTEWITVPEHEKPCGYDLEIGDWVSPYGKGKVSDFIFTMKSRFDAIQDSEASYILVFNNQKDGIQEYLSSFKSTFIWPYLAPKSFYLKSLSKFEFRGSSPEDNYIYKTNNKNNNKYIFRVRTKTDASGKIIRANYGYVDSEIECNRFENGRIRFSYYLNSNNQSRSLEWNGVNLFDDKKKQEKDYKKYRKRNFGESEDK